MTAGGAHARALEDRIRALLHEHAATVEPGDGLLEIRARIARRPWWRRALAHLTASKTAAPGLQPEAAAKAAPIREDTAMPIIHHEDASVYGKGVVHHPLSGRPEFKGLIDGADGPAVRIQDGDLVLTIDDLATLLRWRDTFSLAAVQLQMGLDRTAQNGSTR